MKEPYIFFLACFASIGGVLFGYTMTPHHFYCRFIDHLLGTIKVSFPVFLL